MSALTMLQQVAVNKFSESRSGFDPATITVILEVVKTVTQILSDCKKSSKEAADIANNPTFLQKFVLTQQVRKTLGVRSFRDYGSDVVDAVLAAGKSVTPDVMSQVFAELG